MPTEGAGAEVVVVDDVVAIELAPAVVVDARVVLGKDPPEVSVVDEDEQAAATRHAAMVMEMSLMPRRYRRNVDTGGAIG